jgi:hypothetical protein
MITLFSYTITKMTRDQYHALAPAYDRHARKYGEEVRMAGKI